MSNRRPVISALMIAKDRERLIGSAIESILTQDGPELELLVVDDGSSDGTVQVAAAMADNLTARYGSALIEFNTRLQVKVKSETALPGGRGVRVSTQMLRQGGAPIPVDYLLRNVNGQWKLFDVMVEGISYVQAFKNQFAAPLAQKSIRQVAADLRAGRMQASATPPGKKSK